MESNNLFGIRDVEQDVCYHAVYIMWRAKVEVEELHQNVIADFSRPIGA
jgi:hypothetical protein